MRAKIPIPLAIFRPWTQPRRHSPFGDRYRAGYEQPDRGTPTGTGTSAHCPISGCLRGRHAKRPHAI
jgi:hypothetical protein